MKTRKNDLSRSLQRRIGDILICTGFLTLLVLTSLAPAAMAQSSGAQEETLQIPETPAFIPESEIENLKSEEKAAEARAREKQIREALTPPDGKWLTDENGVEYFVQKVPKVEGEFRWIDDKTVRLRHGAYFKLVDHDDENFFVKVFKRNFEPTPHNQPPKPTEEQLAAVEAAYAVDVMTADTLRFVPFDRGLPRNGQWRNGFDLADMNADGHLDIVHGPMRKGGGSPHVFLSDGKGNWRRWSEAHFDRMRYDYGDVAAGDFNGDGKLDLALAAHLRGLTVLVGDGEGNFKKWSEGLVFGQLGQVVETTHFTSRAIDVGDWDGDGRADLLALSEGPRHPKAMDRAQVANPLGVVIYRSTDEGAWAVQEAMGAEAEIFGDSLALGDFNGDGRLDVVVATNAQGRRNLLFLNPGNNEPPTSVELPKLRPNAYVWNVAAEDVDGNGRDDVILSYSAIELGTWRTGVDVIYSMADGDEMVWDRKVLGVREDRGNVTYSAAAVGDLDGDGQLDVVTGAVNGVIEIYRGLGEGKFVREAAPGLAQQQPGCKVYDLAIRDLDGDAKGEVVAAFAGETCGTLGSLRVWRAVVSDESGAKTASTSAS